MFEAGAGVAAALLSLLLPGLYDPMVQRTTQWGMLCDSLSTVVCVPDDCSCGVHIVAVWFALFVS